ncbi:MAG: flotillin-like protein FloA [Verrucomicrobiota bacterium]|nr:flotillin-like protein FloA [Verrucomicrobiota bacterium]
MTLALTAVLFVVALVVIVIVWNFFSAWLRAAFSKAPVSFMTLIALRLRRVPVGLVVDQRITAVKAGLTGQLSEEVEADELSTHYLANGDIVMVIAALIAAQKAGIPLTFDAACAIDLATRQTDKNVLDAVMTSVNPRVIDCPDTKTSGRTTIDAVAKDGIQLRARARVTVRTNLKGFVGGATEETIIARVGEGIVTTIGSSETYKNVLENPDEISKTVMAKGLDSGTAFEILSVDVADVDVGENIGAKLQAEQAESNKLVAQAQAEVRRAAAVATEQEMKARVHEMRARVVEAEAQVPLAMADAFRSGNLGVMDYLRMKNLQADTGMRTSIGDSGDSDDDQK